jgi:hypothetical protein
VASLTHPVSPKIKTYQGGGNYLCMTEFESVLSGLFDKKN